MTNYLKHARFPISRLRKTSLIPVANLKVNVYRAECVLAHISLKTMLHIVFIDPVNFCFALIVVICVIYST